MDTRNDVAPVLLVVLAMAAFSVGQTAPAWSSGRFPAAGTDGDGRAATTVTAGPGIPGPVEIAAGAHVTGTRSSFDLFTRGLIAGGDAAAQTFFVEIIESPSGPPAVPYVAFVGLPGQPTIHTDLGPLCVDPTNPSQTTTPWDAFGAFGGGSYQGLPRIGQPGLRNVYTGVPGLAGVTASFQALEARPKTGAACGRLSSHELFVARSQRIAHSPAIWLRDLARISSPSATPHFPAAPLGVCAAESARGSSRRFRGSRGASTEATRWLSRASGLCQGADHPAHQNPEDAVAVLDASPLHASLQHGELLAKDGVFDGEPGAVRGGEVKERDELGDGVEHDEIIAVRAR